MFKQFIGHLNTITHHKLIVMQLCFRCGLYKQGIFHDMSKYSLQEFIPGIKYYQGFRSPISYEKEVVGYSKAWLHHKGRNKHHFEYWFDRINDEWKPIKMEKKYVYEMYCDRVAACKIYQKEKYTDKSPLEYFYATNDATRMHPETARLLEMLFQLTASKGLNHTLMYMKEELKVNPIIY